MENIDITNLIEERDNLKTAILDSFLESFPQYEGMTECYEDIRFEEEEIQDWKDYFEDELRRIDEITNYLPTKRLYTETLEEYIANSEPALAMDFTEHEIEQIADAVRAFLRTKQEPVEGLFGDEDEYLLVIQLKNI